ncbi:hypothetical protein CSOJ01_00317 [Colletotrichum sojae]|uniref:Uncharacterized protein n=1 Tax=Colletotrichum sojae TaxID=2175907 RepID=A0A8H6N6J5_9PEZI|nr:hypothetical protein CSOJ01_00317 [Colletotrichum sojae]
MHVRSATVRGYSSIVQIIVMSSQLQVTDTAKYVLGGLAIPTPTYDRAASSPNPELIPKVACFDLCGATMVGLKAALLRLQTFTV